MFIKPQIISTPHLTAPLGDAAAHACASGYSACPSGFSSCSPYGTQGCVDTGYDNGIVGGVIGGVAIVGVVVVGGVVVR